MGLIILLIGGLSVLAFLAWLTYLILAWLHRLVFPDQEPGFATRFVAIFLGACELVLLVYLWLVEAFRGSATIGTF